jgi:hypothetical protein
MKIMENKEDNEQVIPKVSSYTFKGGLHRAAQQLFRWGLPIWRNAGKFGQ